MYSNRKITCFILKTQLHMYSVHYTCIVTCTLYTLHMYSVHGASVHMYVHV